MVHLGQTHQNCALARLKIRCRVSPTEDASESRRYIFLLNAGSSMVPLPQRLVMGR